MRDRMQNLADELVERGKSKGEIDLINECAAAADDNH
jgi:hypothetical protein